MRSGACVCDIYIHDRIDERNSKDACPMASHACPAGAVIAVALKNLSMAVATHLDQNLSLKFVIECPQCAAAAQLDEFEA